AENEYVGARQACGRFLQVQYAFHSSQMDPVRAELLPALADIRPRRAGLPLWSTVTGARADGTELGPDYWWRNVRQTVRFADAVNAIIDAGADAFVELSPHPVLAASVQECLRAKGKSALVSSSLRRKEDERVTMPKALGELHAAGLPVDWAGVGPEGRHAEMPKYSWQHERCWFMTEQARRSVMATDVHPLLGAPQEEATPAWEADLDRPPLNWLPDHQVQGQPLFPGTGYLELAYAAAKQTDPAGFPELEDVKFVKACFLPGDAGRSLQTTLRPADGVWQVFSRGAGESA